MRSWRYLRQIQKQIHFFLLAARAEATAFSVCCRLPVSHRPGIPGEDVPSLDVRVYSLCLTFDVDDSLVLLFNQHGHFREHLCEFGKGLFDLLNFGMSFLNFTVCTSSSTVSVRVEELMFSSIMVMRKMYLQPERRLEGYHFP